MEVIRWEEGPPFLAASRQGKVALFGAPLDMTTSYRSGTRLGPRRIREASQGLEEFSLEQEGSLEEVSFSDLGDLLLPLGDVQGSLEVIQEAASRLLDEGRIPFALGGEHLITYPLVKAALERYPDLFVLQLDAHADLREEYLGVALSHACVIRRLAEVMDPRRLVQIGIRSGTREELAFARSWTRFFPFEARRHLPEILSLPGLKAAPVYITLDIDVLDPAVVPGTGTPEPGGLFLEELLDVLKAFSSLSIVAVDLVELSPPWDPTGRSELVAAKLVREMLIAWFREGGQG